MNGQSPGPGFIKLPDWSAFRRNPKFSADPVEKEYGHWWIEIGHDESYGFWPSQPVPGLLKTLAGVPGDVNRVSWIGNPTRDPDHGFRGNGINEFDVWAPAGTDIELLRNDVRQFAENFKARWAWPATPFTGENCHSFQNQLLREFGLRVTAR